MWAPGWFKGELDVTCGGWGKGKEGLGVRAARVGGATVQDGEEAGAMMGERA